jgi:hypothetical protein
MESMVDIIVFYHNLTDNLFLVHPENSVYLHIDKLEIFLLVGHYQFSCILLYMLSDNHLLLVFLDIDVDLNYKNMNYHINIDYKYILVVYYVKQHNVDHFYVDKAKSYILVDSFRNKKKDNKINKINIFFRFSIYIDRYS